MMSRLFLIPLILALIWWLIILNYHIRWAIAKKGFLWILGLGVGLASFLTLMLWLTNT